jgi:hypothetical protein
LWALYLLREKAQLSGQFPKPLTWSYLADLAWNIGSRQTLATIKRQVEYCFEHTMVRIKTPAAPIAYNLVIDELLASHGILARAPL